MVKKLRLTLIMLVAVLAAMCFSACDPSIYDIPEGQKQTLDFKQFLNPTTCYTKLLDDLDYMKTLCVYNQQFNSSLAGTQAFTIMLSYGMADMSKDAWLFTPDQLSTKALLFDEIKMINFYSENFSSSGGAVSVFDKNAILTHTQNAIMYCEEMLTYLQN